MLRTTRSVGIERASRVEQGCHRSSVAIRQQLDRLVRQVRAMRTFGAMLEPRFDCGVSRRPSSHALGEHVFPAVGQAEALLRALGASSIPGSSWTKTSCAGKSRWIDGRAMSRVRLFRVSSTAKLGRRTDARRASLAMAWASHTSHRTVAGRARQGGDGSRTPTRIPVFDIVEPPIDRLTHRRAPASQHRSRSAAVPPAVRPGPRCRPTPG